MKRAQTGVTLIELMFVVLIMGLLVFVAVPLTGNWIDNAKLTEAQGVMEQAVGRAKAAALRNPVGVSGATAATKLCLNAGRVSLRQAQASDQAAACDGAGTVFWSAAIPANVADSGGNNVSCLCFDSKSMLLNSTCGGGGTCTTTLTLELSAGTENETFSFH